jgi:multimeric flavodoxin WrbA
MNVLAIVGSPRKGKSTDTLVDKAIEGVKSKNPECVVTKIHLADQNIESCRNCLVCRDSKSPGPYAKCVIRDDMDQISEEIVRSDVLIFGSPIHMGSTTSLMLKFLERICWTFAKPEASYLTVHGCPTPRAEKERKAAIIVTSGIIPPYFKMFCNSATPLMKQTIKDSLNANTVGALYAGDIEHRGVEAYLEKAFTLGTKLS